MTETKKDPLAELKEIVSESLHIIKREKANGQTRS